MKKMRSGFLSGTIVLAVLVFAASCSKSEDRSGPSGPSINTGGNATGNTQAFTCRCVSTANVMGQLETTTRNFVINSENRTEAEAMCLENNGEGLIQGIYTIIDCNLL